MCNLLHLLSSLDHFLQHFFVTISVFLLFSLIGFISPPFSPLFTPEKFCEVFFLQSCWCCSPWLQPFQTLSLPLPSRFPNDSFFLFYIPGTSVLGYMVFHLVARWSIVCFCITTLLSNPVHYKTQLSWEHCCTGHSIWRMKERKPQPYIKISFINTKLQKGTAATTKK